MFENLDNAEIEEVISNNFIGRLGCYDDGKVYVVPISYAYDCNYIYARTFEGMKISMMRNNPNVCFQLDQMGNMADWKSVIAWGTYEELTDEKARNKGLQILISRILPNISSETVKLSPEWPFPTNDYKQIEGIVFRIQVTEKTGRCEKMDMDDYKK